MKNLEGIKRRLKELILRTQIELPEDVYNSILSIEKNFKLSNIGVTVLKCMLENLELAKTLRRPICQDTGTHIFFIRCTRCIDVHKICSILTDAVREATLEIPLRPNAIDPITCKNTGTGVGKGIPEIEIDIDHVTDKKDTIEIVYIPKGGGCELPCRAFCVPPSIGFSSLKKATIGLVRSYGRYACPPLTIGIGIGATIHSAIKNAMKALYLRKIGERSDNDRVAKIEEELLDECNRTQIGIQGIGEGPTVLDVHIEYSCRHPATFSIAIVTSCWVLRRGVLILEL